MLILSALAMAHVWGGEEPDFTLPRNIAVPLMALSQRLGRPPIVMHATLVLNNWRRLDPARPLALDNIDTQFTFTGSFDEKWFYLATLGVETGRRAGNRRAGRCGHGIADRRRCRTHRPSRRRSNRHPADESTALMRMTERCDPYVFYNRIRPYLAGWPAPGLTYAGTGTAPQVWAGGSAAQSALLQSFDAGSRHPARACPYPRLPRRDAAIHAAEPSRAGRSACARPARSERGRTTAHPRCAMPTMPASRQPTNFAASISG